MTNYNVPRLCNYNILPTTYEATSMLPTSQAENVDFVI